MNVTDQNSTGSVLGAIRLICCAGFLFSLSAYADIIHNDDVIVEGSVCSSSGDDCANLENFTSGTAQTFTVEMKLKDDNPSIGFDSTITGGNRDWAIATLNAGSDGHDFFVQNETATPFWIEPQTGNNLLRLDSNERIGINTATPSHTVHVVGSRIRMQSGLKNLYMRADGTDVDLQAEGADLFLRSATAGRNIIMNPFTNDGLIGIGTTNPTQKLTVFGSSTEATNAQIKVEDQQGSAGGVQTLFNLTNNGPPAFRFYDAVNDQTWQFRGAQNGSFKIDDPSTSVTEAEFLPGGTMRLGGALVQTSSRTAKESITRIDTNEILTKVLALAISEWSYKADDPNVRHMGPMAEDFYKAFQLGHNPMGISSVDTAGVTLAAIQGLHQLMMANDAKIARLEKQVAQLKAQQTRSDLPKQDIVISVTNQTENGRKVAFIQ